MEQLIAEGVGALNTLPVRVEALITMAGLSMGLAWACGVNLYGALFAISLMATIGLIELPSKLELMATPVACVVALTLYLVEFFAARITAVDTGWDLVHVFIYVPAGSLMAAAAASDYGTMAVIGMGVSGAMVTWMTHNSLLGNGRSRRESESLPPWAGALWRDLVMMVGVWFATHLPMFFIPVLVIFMAVIAL